MTDLTFANPDWLWGALLLLPLLALRVWAHWHSRGKLPGLVSPRLMGQLVNGSSRSQRWVVFFLRTTAIVALFVALARPQLGYEDVETHSDSRNLIIAVDTSRSMLANDLTPNRLARSKLAATDIVRALPQDRIGLMAFAGRPFLQAPLTVDHEAVIEAIDQLDTEVIPRGGTNLAAAAALALETFQEAKLDQSTLVIFSDGEALEGAEELEKVRSEAAEAGMTIIAVGVGTREGSIIPELDDQGNAIAGAYLKDRDGQVIRSRLETGAIRSLAGERGLYVHLGGRSSLSRVVEEIEKGIATTREENDSQLRPIERFMWPLAAALLLFVISHFAPLLWLKPRQPQQALVPGPAASLLFASFFLTSFLPAKDALELGYESYQAEDYDTAIRTYEGALSGKASKRDRSRLQMGLGSATYRQGNFERAAEAFGQALVDSPEEIRELAHYNLGNTLFRQGEAGLTELQTRTNPDALQNLSSPTDQREKTIRQWEGAIEHYESALALNAGNAQAGHNLELVKKRLEELKNQQEQEQEEQQQDQQQEQQQSDRDQDQEDENQEQQSEQEEQQDSEDESQQQESQENEQEQDPGEEEQEQNQSSESGEGDQEEPEEQNGENEQDPSNENEDQDGQGQQPPQQQEPPQQPDAPNEGELGAQPDQPQNTNANPGGMSSGDSQQNPETGYSPSEARQLLEALSDETEVRPVLTPSGNENYKNW